MHPKISSNQVKLKIACYVASAAQFFAFFAKTKNGRAKDFSRKMTCEKFAKKGPKLPKNSPKCTLKADPFSLKFKLGIWLRYEFQFTWGLTCYLLGNSCSNYTFSPWNLLQNLLQSFSRKSNRSTVKEMAIYFTMFESKKIVKSVSTKILLFIVFNFTKYLRQFLNFSRNIIK